MVYRYTRYEMKDKHLIVILLSFIVAITLVSCTDKTTNSAEVVSSTEAITSEESTTTEVATSETINVTTSCETTTVPVINEDVYVSDAFPNVNIQSSTDGTITFSIELDDENVIEEINFNHDWSTYRVFRADKKIISLWLFGCDYDTSNREYLRQTYVYNTSGEKLELTDILTNEERFIEYLNNQGRNVETNNLNEIDWVFDLYGLIIMSDCDTGLNNSLVISYEEFEGMINSNYIPDAGDPIYGTIRWGTVAF